MNEKLKSVIVKSLLIFLSASFILFGIINYFNGISDTNLIKVNKKQISLNTFLTFLNNKRTQLMQQNIIDDLSIFDSQEFIALALREFINENLFELQVEKLNLKSPKEIMFRDIYVNKNFANNNGKFDKDIFKTNISQIGYSEKMYLDILSVANGREILGQIIMTSNLANNKLTKDLLEDENKYYIVNVYTIDVKNAGGKGKIITDEDIKEYYLSNRFDMPKEMEISYIEINLDKSNTTATELEDLILASKNLDEIAKEFGLKKQITKTKPDDVSNEFMQYEEGTFSDLVHKEKNDYKIYYIEKLQRARILTLEEATPIIKKKLNEENIINSAMNWTNNVIKELQEQNTTNTYKFKILRNQEIYKNDIINYSEEILSNVFKLREPKSYTAAYLSDDRRLITFLETKDIREIKTDNDKYVESDVFMNRIWKSYNDTKFDRLQKYLVEKNKVTINNKLLNNLLNFEN
ncbi:MAG: peptidylprolyl isomerase [Rickettsiales bacterium]|jgi:hypothetical protein|nr:peptidylprolyl isomerase [Rickettsiales bacterium]